MRVLFVIDSMPCHRFLKESRALSKMGMELYCCFRERGAAIARGADLSQFRTVLKLKKRGLFEKKKILEFIKSHKIDIIHYHNYPDRLGYRLLRYGTGLPFIYDQHDFMSLQRESFSRQKKKWERYCLEQADGLVFVTDYYQKMSFAEYIISSPYVVLPNIVSGSSGRAEEVLTEKLSGIDGRIHLVWIGLITTRRAHHRYMLKVFSILSKAGFIIHVYPTRGKDYAEYRSIEGLELHEQLSYEKMMGVLGRYDAGIAFFNPFMEDRRKSELICHAFPNKVNDYIFAGIPPVTLACHEPMAGYIEKYGTGYVFDNPGEIQPDIIRSGLREKSENIRNSRGRIIQDINEQVVRIKELYIKVMEGYHGEA